MDIGHNLIPLVGIVMSMGMPIILVGLILWYQLRKNRSLHETAIRLAEKGQPVPPEFFLGKPSPQSDLRRGLVLIGLGIGLSACLAQIEQPWGFGLIPFSMGIGYLWYGSWKVRAKHKTIQY